MRSSSRAVSGMAISGTGSGSRGSRAGTSGIASAVAMAPAMGRSTRETRSVQIAVRTFPRRSRVWLTMLTTRHAVLNT